MKRLVLAAGALLAAHPLSAAPAGTSVTYQGSLAVSEQSATGLFDLQVCLFDVPSGGEPLACAAELDSVPVEAGVFTVDLDFGGAVFAGEARYLELRLRAGSAQGADAYTLLSPRQRLRPAPESLRSAATPWAGITGLPAGFADGVDDTAAGVSAITAGFGLAGGTVTTTGTFAVDAAVVQRRVAGECAAGSAIARVNADGTVQCTASIPGGGTVTSVGAGTGLTGGPITSSGTLSVNTGAIQARVSGTCAAGSTVRAVLQDGTVQCEAHGTVTSVAAGTGLTGGAITASGTLAVDTAVMQRRVSGACATGSSVSAVNADGSVQCVQSGGSVTSVASGFGLTGGPITGSGTLAIDSAVTQRRVTGQCTMGSMIASINQDGTVACVAASSGTVTNIATGAGLTGGPITTTGTIGLAEGGIGLQHIDTDEVQARVTGACAAGTYLRAILATGDVDCAPLPGLNSGSVVYTDALRSTGNFDLALGFDGLPVMSFSNNNELKIARCLDAGCAGSKQIVTLYATPANLTYTSIAIRPGGKPIVAFYDRENYDLKIAVCSTADCSNAQIKLIDATGIVGEYASVAVGGDGKPGISYFDNGNGALRFAKCNDADCTSVGLSTVDTGNVGTFTSLIISSDAASLPTISYVDKTLGALKVAACSTATCSAATKTVLDDPADMIDGQTSIAAGRFDSLYPLIAYRDATAGALKVAKCKNAACTASTPVVLDDPATNAVGAGASLAIGNDGLPVIAHIDTTTGALRVVKCHDSGCGSGAAITAVDDTDYFGASTGLVLGSDGLPLIVHGRGSIPGLVKVTHCGSRACL